MITILEKYKSVIYEKGFLNWTFGVLRNKIGDYFKRKKVKPMLNNDEIIDPNPIEPNIDLIGLRGIIEKEIINLSKDCKKIIKALLRGYSTGDIISMFPDIPRNTIDSKIHRCRQTLKDILEKGGDLE
jgi:DNA-directed RNA polymerase specialized sigma24 family protein